MVELCSSLSMTMQKCDQTHSAGRWKVWVRVSHSFQYDHPCFLFSVNIYRLTYHEFFCDGCRCTILQLKLSQLDSHIWNFLKHRPGGQAVTRSSLKREIWGLNLRPVKSDTVSPTAHHCCNIFLKGAVLPGHNDAERAPTTSYTLRRITASIMKGLIFIWFWLNFLKPQLDV